jgi:L-ribulokinase
MQTLADVLDMPIKVAKSEQVCALGAAMFAAVASGFYQNIEEAMENMNSGFESMYQPDKANTDLYNKKYQSYINLSEAVEKETMRSLS